MGKNSYAGRLALLAVVVSMVMCGCERPTAAKNEEPPMPQREVVVHPAEAAQLHIVTVYPDLAVTGSTFNRLFLDNFERAKSVGNKVLEQPDWPVILANQTAMTLGVKRAGAATPKATPFRATQSKLDDRAYNRNWRVAGTPRYYPVPGTR